MAQEESIHMSRDMFILCHSQWPRQRTESPRIHSEFKTHENIFFKLVHRTQATHHTLRFDPMLYQDTYSVSGVWKPIFVQQYLYQFSVTTFTSPV